MMFLTPEDKAELLEDARSSTLQMEFAVMNARSAKLTPIEWLDFLTQVSSLTPDLSRRFGRNQPLIKGDNFLL